MTAMDLSGVVLVKCRGQNRCSSEYSQSRCRRKSCPFRSRGEAGQPVQVVINDIGKAGGGGARVNRVEMLLRLATRLNV